MARRQGGILRRIRDEAMHQLRGFPRELKHQLRGFGSEANYQLNRGWGEELARQIFGKSSRGRRSSWLFGSGLAETSKMCAPGCIR